MSYDLYLTDPVSGETLEAEAPLQMRGGTYCVGGSTDMRLNVTYNYAPHFDFRGLDGKTGAETIRTLKSGADSLADNVDPDYWKPTEGNAKRAILQLLALAQMRPDGKWRVS